jgi:plastocyanin
MRLRGHSSRLPAIVVGVIVAIALAGCGGAAYGYGGGAKSTPTPAGGAAGSGGTVTIKDFAFSPQTLTVKAGATVTWVNKDSTPHTVTSVDSSSLDASPTGLFDAQLSQGQTFTFTFDKTGTYNYECTIHKSMASMHATIVVQ